MKVVSKDSFLRILLELVTVFLGVTLAFAAESLRQEIQQDKRRVQLTTALGQDIIQYDSVGGQYVSYLRSGLARYDSLRAAGKRPPPFFLRIDGAERPPTDVWEAAMQSGAGELLDPADMIKLAMFYNEIGGEALKYQRYATFTETRIFPLLESDTTAFYDPSTGDLKPEFKAHMRQLKEIMADLEAQVQAARVLRKDLSGRPR